MYQDGIGGSPNIANGDVHACIEYPDHRLPESTTKKREELVGMPAFYPAVPISKHQRLSENGLMPSVRIVNKLQNEGGGQTVHHSQDRLFTI